MAWSSRRVLKPASIRRLQKLYQAEMPRPIDIELLAHIVSCEAVETRNSQRSFLCNSRKVYFLFMLFGSRTATFHPARTNVRRVLTSRSMQSSAQRRPRNLWFSFHFFERHLPQVNVTAFLLKERAPRVEDDTADARIETIFPETGQH